MTDERFGAQSPACVMDGERSGEIAGGLAGLRTALEAALRLTSQLAGDPVLGRLLAAFQDMPAEDRPVVVEAIERETKARALSRATDWIFGRPRPGWMVKNILRVSSSSVAVAQRRGILYIRARLPENRPEPCFQRRTRSIIARFCA